MQYADGCPVLASSRKVNAFTATSVRGMNSSRAAGFAEVHRIVPEVVLEDLDGRERRIDRFAERTAAG